VALRVCSTERFGYPKFEKRAPDTQLIGDWSVPKTDLDSLGNRKSLAYVVRPSPAFSPCPLSDFRSADASIRSHVISFTVIKFNTSWYFIEEL